MPLPSEAKAPARIAATRIARRHGTLRGKRIVSINAMLRVVGAKIDLERDASGKIVALRLHQNDVDRRAPRIEQ